MRVRGSQLQPERQFRQAGVELIGADESAADAEVILLAHKALVAAGAKDLSVDINLPALVSALCDGYGLSESDRSKLRLALDRKDSAAVLEIGGPAAQVLSTLVAAGGPAAAALAAMRSLSSFEAVEADYDHLAEVIGLIEQRAPTLAVTIDLVENRGFEYHTGLSFTFFGRGVRGELGCGGRYQAGDAGEQATGFSLFLHNLLGAVPSPETDKRIYLSVAMEPKVGEKLRGDGWITVAGLNVVEDVLVEAIRLRCSHFYDGEKPVLAGNDGEI